MHDEPISDQPFMTNEIVFEWRRADDDAGEIVALFISVMLESASYISKGEITCGYSADGQTWSKEFEALFAKDVFKRDSGLSYLTCRNETGVLMAAAAVSLNSVSRVPHAYIEDLVVEKSFRGSGVGSALLQEIEEKCKARKVEWVILESGISNRKAHDFFHTFGYTPVSLNFAKKVEE